MGRKKGGKNAPGHSAGGARKGAGRPRKDGSKAQARERSETYDSVIQPESEDSEHEQQFDADQDPHYFQQQHPQPHVQRVGSEVEPEPEREQPPEPSPKMIAMADIHPAFIPFLNIPHHIPLQISVNHIAHAPFPQSVPRSENALHSYSPASFTQVPAIQVESANQASRTRSENPINFVSRQHSMNATPSQGSALQSAPYAYMRPTTSHSQQSNLGHIASLSTDSRTGLDAEQARHANTPEPSHDSDVGQVAHPSPGTRSSPPPQDKPPHDIHDAQHTRPRVLAVEPQHYYPSPVTPRVSAPPSSSPSHVQPSLPTPPLQTEALHSRTTVRHSSEVQAVTSVPSAQHPNPSVFYMPNRQVLQAHPHLPPPPPNTLSPSQMHYHYHPSQSSHHNLTSDTQPVPQINQHTDSPHATQSQTQARAPPLHSPPMLGRDFSPRNSTSERVHMQRGQTTSPIFVSQSPVQSPSQNISRLPMHQISQSQVGPLDDRSQTQNNEASPNPSRTNLNHPSSPLPPYYRKPTHSPSKGRAPLPHWQSALPSPPSSSTLNLGPPTHSHHSTHLQVSSSSAIQPQLLPSPNPRSVQSVSHTLSQDDTAAHGHTQNASGLQNVTPAYHDQRQVGFHHRPSLPLATQTAQPLTSASQSIASQQQLASSVTSARSFQSSQSAYQPSAPAHPMPLQATYSQSQLQRSPHLHYSPYTLPPVQPAPPQRQLQRTPIQASKPHDSSFPPANTARPQLSGSRYQYPPSPPQLGDQKANRLGSSTPSEANFLNDVTEEDYLPGLSDSAGGRQRRRCAVCMQKNNPQYAYDCPGRGDRTLCVSVNAEGKLAEPRPYGLEPLDSLRVQRPRHKERDEGDATARSTASDSMTGQSRFEPPEFKHVTSRPKVTSKTGSESRLVILASGQSNKRKRRCAICVKQGRDGLECPGRGNRNLCSTLSRTNGAAIKL